MIDKLSMENILKAYPMKFIHCLQTFSPEKLSVSILEYARQLSHALITVGGKINRDFIDPFTKTFPWIDPNQRIHFDTVLKALENNVYFSDRLDNVKTPVQNTRQADVVRASGQKDDKISLDVNDVREAILSALLWPL